MFRTPSTMLLAALAAVVAPLGAWAQEVDAVGGEGWNSPRVIELLERARERRALPDPDSGLFNYRAEAGGYLYYYLDHADSDDRTLVKVDQIALEVYWASPNRTKQRIIGLRAEEKLPSRIYYHLDHLTVVQNEFDDRIRMGDGDEVRDVLHPAAPGAESVYDYRLADSLAIHLPGKNEPIRVYEVEVRPRRSDLPAFVGSIFLDRATAAIVRMTFTFTPASYVDPQIDYIHVSLENGLWEGRYWLPSEQRLEIRRQLRVLDLPAGGVIRGVMRIRNYRFNEPIPAVVFQGAPVTALPKSIRENHAFEEGIYAGLEAEGLAPPADLETIRHKARALAGVGSLSGLPRLRVAFPNASSVFRYNRAEGLFLGAGAIFAPAATTRLEATAGWAFGARHAPASVALHHAANDEARLRLRVEHNVLRDVGLRPGTPGILNSIQAALFGDDDLDPYHASGVSLTWSRDLGSSWRVEGGLAWERHRTASLVTEHAPFDDKATFRPVRSIDEGTLVSATATLGRTIPPARPDGWALALHVEGGRFASEPFVRPILEAAIQRTSADHRRELHLRGTAGVVAGMAPPQKLFLVGGRGTLPGYPYRAFAGDRFALAEAEASHAIRDPWLRIRLLGAVGWTDFGNHAPPADWGALATDGVRSSIGVGVGLLYDVIRVDFAHGLNGGRWQTNFSVHPKLQGML